MTIEVDRAPVHEPRVIGARAPRVEDPKLLTGQGCFVDDIQLPNTLYAAFVRSPHAHALIGHIDASKALQLPGVRAIYTAKELESVLVKLRMPLGFPTTALPQNITPFVLCPKEVCFVGEALAVVVAESRHIAEDAAELIEVTYEPLPMVHDCRQSLEPNAPSVRLESPSNELNHFKVTYGEIDHAFAQAHCVVKASMSTHRGAAHPIEGRGVLADFSGQAELTVWSSTQMSHDLRQMLSELLGLNEDLSLIHISEPTRPY